MNFWKDLGDLRCSSQRALETAESIVKNRVKLAALELKEEESRASSVAICGGLFPFSSFMAVISVACTALFFFWEQMLYVGLGLLGFVRLLAWPSFCFLKKDQISISVW